MYTIHADGQLLFSSLSEDVGSIVLTPKLSLDVENSGSLSFVIPPGNALHGKLKKLKGALTVEQDGVQIARFRVMETENDNYNQQSVYCEGDKAYLNDSVHAPYSYEGTVHGLFRKLLDNHNANVEAEKQFEHGVITVVDENETTEVLNEVYAATADEMSERLLNAYGGYLRTRVENSIHYLDWVEHYGDVNSQPIEFGVNMLDITDKADASDVFTVLIPLGATEVGSKEDKPLTIESVNNGLNYIQDDEAVARYGKIWRTYTWSHVSNASELLKKGREYLKTGITLETLTLKAVDMHFVDGNIQPIRLGDRVRILSDPHGLDKVMLCTQVEIDLLNPENTLYTFGEKPRTLTDNVVMKEKGGGGGGGGRADIEEEVSNIQRWAKIIAEEQEAYIQLTAGELNRLNGNLSAVELEMDGVAAEMQLAASRLDNVEGRTRSAEIAIDGANATITLQASELSELSQSVSEARIDIDGVNSQIRLKADKTVVDGILSTGLAGVGVLSATRVSANNAYFDSLTLNDDVVVQHDVTLLKSVTLNTSKVNIKDFYGENHSVIATASLTTETETLVYLST